MRVTVVDDDGTPTWRGWLPNGSGCAYAWGDTGPGNVRNHHECAQPEGHLDDHICNTCGKSRPNNEPWKV
jgi:hypothetical protein